MRKVCVITNSRADYSRLKTVLSSLNERKDVDLQLFVVGTHLLSHYGMTVKEIIKDGFNVSYEMYTEVNGSVPATMAKSVGTTIIELSSAFKNFSPDIVVVHGDRYEALAAAITASMMNIPVAHIQGGEVTGTIDEHVRHAITKLAHFHFPSSEDAKERIIRLGEKPENVFNVGCPASDLLLSEKEISFEELKKQVFKITKKEDWKNNFDENFFLVVYHPVTTEFNKIETEVENIFQALTEFDNSIVMLWPNIDAGSEKIVEVIKRFEKIESLKIGVFDNFPINTFVNLMRYAKVMIGNSSSGVREACYFGTPVVNIGTRQQGRERSKNVIDVGCDKDDITEAIREQLKHGRYDISYLYGGGTAGKKIADILTSVNVDDTQKRITF